MMAVTCRGVRPWSYYLVKRRQRSRVRVDGRDMERVQALVLIPGKAPPEVQGSG